MSARGSGRTDEVVVGRVEPSGVEPVAPGEVRPDRDVAALVVLVPARAAGLPDAAAQPTAHPPDKAVLDVGAHLESVGAGVVCEVEGLEDIADLRLDHE